MARNDGESPEGSSNDKSGSSEENLSKKIKVKTKKKEVNSWDCSSSISNELNVNGKHSDWDLSSDCQETTVEPFDDNVCKYNNSDFEENFQKDDFINDKKSKSRLSSPYSSEASILNFIGEDNSLFDVFNNDKKIDYLSQINSVENKSKEDILHIEDIEDFAKDKSKESTSTSTQSSIKSEAEIETQSNRTLEDTPDDTTIWMIQKSEKSQSTTSNSKFFSSCDKEAIKNLHKSDVFLKKVKSASNVEKNKKKSNRSSKSDGQQHSGYDKTNIKIFLTKCEGSSERIKSEPVNWEKLQENPDETKKYFSEYECRTIILNKDRPEKTPSTTTSTCSGPQETVNETSNNTTNDCQESIGENQAAVASENNYGFALPGTSNQASMEVVSLPDIVGRNFIKNRSTKEKLSRRHTSPKNAKGESDVEATPNDKMKNTNESWVLLDETGQCQEITRNEVSILLNGRSADAVLQRHKEHLIQSTNFTDGNSQNPSLSGLFTKESIQNILREEDVGGEGQTKKLIDLERKVENTLLYIQPGMNLTASIRIIPVDTEMIHIWRRSRDTGSLLSSDVDLRFQTSQDSVENLNQKNSNDHHAVFLRRINKEKLQQTVAEQDENGAVEIIENSPAIDHAQDYSRLLIETRIIVDSLANSFKLLQSRLDGETSRSLALQEEINKLRELLNEPEEKLKILNESRETLSGHQQMDICQPTSNSPQQYQTPNKIVVQSESLGNCKESGSRSGDSTVLPKGMSKEHMNEKSPTSSGHITVNIYTTDDSWHNCPTVGVQETNSLLQANLRFIEGKMKRFQEENEIITRQNIQLKRKLKEISLELEKYLASTTEADTDKYKCTEEEKDTDTLRDQVCNLKLELDNLKKSAAIQEREVKIKNELIQEQLEKNLIILKEWYETSDKIIQKLEKSRRKFLESGIFCDKNLDFEGDSRRPEHILRYFNSFMQLTTDQLIKVQNENMLYGKSILMSPRVCEDKDEFTKEEAKLDKVISGYTELIEECRKMSTRSEGHVMEDYFAVIVEKASLTEELKVLKTENEMLMQSQMEHYEKLKQTMIALKDRKNEITTLKSTQKLSEEEKTQMADVLKVYEEQNEKLEEKLLIKNKTIEELLKEKNETLADLNEKNDKLKVASEEIESIERSCRLKDDLINEFKLENEELKKKDEMKKNQIEILKEELRHIEMKKTQLESEITSTKLYMNESQKEMAEYINHLETIVNNNQETLEKNKQKLKDSNQTLSRLKIENEALHKQYQHEVEFHKNSKIELETSNQKVQNINKKIKELEEENSRLQEKTDVLVNSDKKKSDALDKMAKEFKLLENENNNLKEKVDIFVRDRDDSLKEQKDLINKYALISKELQKIQEKYRHVKAECNERTNVIKYLEMMLRENIIEYNSRIAHLENNVTHILNKIAACKSTMKENHVGVDAEIKNLRQQLNTTYQERKELENLVDNYSSVMKHLENQVREREKKVDELHVILSGENQKTIHGDQSDNAQKILENNKRSTESFKIEKLEKELSECKKQLEQSEIDHKNEKKKLDLIITDLKTEINKYQIKTEVMMKNLSSYNKNLCVQNNENRRSDEEIAKKVQVMTNNLEAKDKKIVELNDIIKKYIAKVKMREIDLEKSKKKNIYISEMLKNLKNEASKMEGTLLATTQTNEKQQKEKNEIIEKLMHSIKIIMEEKSARQTLELLAIEKEKSFKEKLDQLKNELDIKTKSCKTLSEEINEKNRTIIKLQQDLKKIKSKLANYEKNIYEEKNKSCIDKENHTGSLIQLKYQNFSPERIESCLKELEKVRSTNLQLRKSEGESQAKITQLEDEIREARLIIKELEAGITVEKKSKKAFKNMIILAQKEIEKCLTDKQIIPPVASRIRRYFDLEEDTLHEIRLLKRKNSPEIYG